MADEPEELIRLRRYKLYRRLYGESLQATREDENIQMSDIVQATCMLLVNEIKIVERIEPNYHIKLLQHLIDLFDDPELFLDDENKPH